MRDSLKALTSGDLEGDSGHRLGGLRAAAAQLLIATAAEVVLERFGSVQHPDRRTSHPLDLAPLLVAPLAAAAQLEHARSPREATARALKLLNTTSIVLGGVLVAIDLLDDPRAATRAAPLTLASAGLLGLVIDAEEAKLTRKHQDLVRRARVVERLVPKRKPRLDRIVVHV